MEDSRNFFNSAGKPQEDFELWATRTETALQAREIYVVVQSDVVGNAEDALDPDTLVTIAKARALIMQGLEEKPLRACMSEKQNPYRMWKCLRERYAVANVSTQVQLQMKLKRLRYPEQSLSDFIDGFGEVFNRLEGINSLYPEQMQVAQFLSSFGEKSTSSYGPVVAALQTSPQTLIRENVTGRMLQEYEEKQHNKEDSGSVYGIGSKVVMASKRGPYDGRKRTETGRC